MIVTGKKQIPMMWQLAVASPWGAMRFKYMIMGAVFIFSMTKFIENPAQITFIMSIPSMATLMVSPIVNFLSDRIWTRWGRRKPFAVPSIFGVVICFALMPFMPNIWLLIIVYFFYELFHDFGNASFEVLKQEVVPPKQRVTASAIGTWIQNIANLSFYLFALGRFDDYQFYAGFPVTGEQSLYWAVAIILGLMGLIVVFGIKETYQPSKLRGQKITIKTVVGGLLNRDLWPVYLLIVGWIVAHAGLGSLGALLYTQQWGFTKQEMGINVAVGSTLNIFLIVLIGMFAHKLPRMKTFEVLLVVAIFIEVAFFVYVEFILFDKTPSLVEVILFGELGAVNGILLGMIYTPLVYDYVPRNEMGTFAAGRNLVGQGLRIIILNGVGVFVTVYSMIFMPPGGDMVRVTLNEMAQESEVREIILEAGEEGISEDNLSVETYYATNAAWKDGYSFEIRRKNKDVVKLQKEIDKLQGELSKILVAKSNAEAAAERAKRSDDLERASSKFEEAEQLGEDAAPLEAQIEELQNQQNQSAAEFQDKLNTILGSSLMADGEQIIDAYEEEGLLFTVELGSRPSNKNLKRTLDQLRLTRPDILDLRLTYDEDVFLLEISVLSEGITNFSVRELEEDFLFVASSRIGDSLLDSASFSNPENITVSTLKVKTVEDPLNNHISPITGAIYSIWDKFGDPPTIERRAWATARALRSSEASNHVGVWDATEGDRHQLLIRAVYGQAFTGGVELGNLSEEESVVYNRFNQLLSSDTAKALVFYDLYQRSLSATSQNKLTIPTPFLEARFAKVKYDYMSGYLWMILLSVIGLFICLMFTRREKKGLISKRGRIEAEREAAAESQREGEKEEGSEYYVPGLVPQKILMLVFSLIVLGIGLLELVPKLSTVVSGDKYLAVATKVVKERIGGDEEDLITEAQIIEANESFDRSFVFWNYFSYKNGNGEVIEFRAPTGKQLQPEYSLVDEDGLPTLVTIYVEHSEPSDIVMAHHYGTWFLSGCLTLFGLLGSFWGCVMLYSARRPILMPVIQSYDGASK